MSPVRRAFSTAGAAISVAACIADNFPSSSMLAALTAITLVCGLEQPLPYRLLVIAGSIYVIVRHRANIQRLLAGTEPRVAESLESKTESQISCVPGTVEIASKGLLVVLVATYCAAARS